MFFFMLQQVFYVLFGIEHDGRGICVCVERLCFSVNVPIIFMSINSFYIYTGHTP